MRDEILINTSPAETRVALLDNGVLQELFIERISGEATVGNIYCGKVVRVLPGMQAAFVDIGFERTAFLHINDINLSALNKPANTDISDVVRQGQLLSVQIMKDPLGSKGARLTTYYSLSSHYLVYMPDSANVGISQRIDNQEERERLQALMGDLAEQLSVAGGFIVRTAAESCEAAELLAEVQLLSALWQSAKAQIKTAKLGEAIYKELPMVQRILRDAAQGGVERVLVDDPDLASELRVFAQQFVAEVDAKISFYDGKRPIFDVYAIEDEINKALARRVELKSGGYVIFDQTEAMTTVDVNTGAFVGKKRSDETAYKTNLEAAAAIARQLRVRNLGGMIIVDFIDMPNENHRLELNRAFDHALAQDRAKTARFELQELGLAALTRKRTRESLEHILCDSCAVCDGKGRVRSVETVINDLFRDIYRETAAHEKQQLVVVVATEVGTILIDEASERLSEIETQLGVTVQVRIEAQYGRDEFDVILL